LSKKVDQVQAIPAFSGSTIFISQQEDFNSISLIGLTFIGLYANLGSILVVNGEQNETYISDIQHVRRRETAMTPLIPCNASLPVATTKK
jgi:hypothetical protein